MTLVVVVGNPKPASRTLDAATNVASRLAGRPADVVIDLVELGPALLTSGDDEVARAVGQVQAAGARGRSRRRPTRPAIRGS